jgi:RNA polymerase sigma-70 factor (ECF subfamily)
MQGKDLFEGGRRSKHREGKLNKSETDLIREAQEGNHSAFEMIVRRYEKRVLAIAYQIIGNAHDAQDVGQEVFIRLYRFLPQFRRSKQFFTWLYRITVNVCFDHLKKEKRRQTVPLDDYNSTKSESFAAGTDPVSGEIENIIMNLLDQISVPQKTVFVLREMEAFSTKEIAYIMDIPHGTVRSHLHRARQFLLQQLKQHYPEFLEGRIQ